MRKEINMKFCSEITYETNDGYVHSDTGHGNGADEGRPLTDEDRKFYHDLLDEWLNKSNGTGAFWVGDPLYFAAQQW
jgi:gluconate kinase